MSLSYNQLLGYAQQAGFSGTAAHIIAAIALAESGGNPTARNVNTDGSIDRGILQINNKYHNEVSDSCAADVVCSFDAAFRISNNGTNFNPWVTYTTGAYQKYLNGSATASNPPPVTASVQTATTGFDLLSWLTPTRIVKLVTGVVLIGVSLYILLQPQIDKVAANVAKYIPEGA